MELNQKIEMIHTEYRQFLYLFLYETEKLPEFSSSNTEKWGSMHPNYAACSKGKRQSPININTNDVVANKTMKPLSRKYHIYNATLCTDGYDTEVFLLSTLNLAINSSYQNFEQCICCENVGCI